jgi:predicted nucleic acid-binding protein
VTTPPPRTPGAGVERASRASVVVDASALVDLLAGSEYAAAVATRLRGTELHAPAHCEAEVLSALGRLHRGGHLSGEEVRTALTRLEGIPLHRHPVSGLLAGAWQLRASLRLLDALYITLGAQLTIPVVTTDQRLARGHSGAEAVVG